MSKFDFLCEYLLWTYLKVHSNSVQAKRSYYLIIQALRISYFSLKAAATNFTIDKALKGLINAVIMA